MDKYKNEAKENRFLPLRALGIDAYNLKKVRAL